MSYKTILLEKKDGVAVITLNRPPMNPLNEELFVELKDAIDALDADDDVGCVVITGAGDKAFSAGADVKDMMGRDVRGAMAFPERAREAFLAIESCGKAVIAAINGFAFGGGCELALSCDFRFASDKAKIGQPEINLAITPGGGGTQRLPRLIGPSKAKMLLFTGDIISAEEALRIGLVDRVFSADRLMDETMEFAKKIASKPKLALRLIKQAVNNGLGMDLLTALKYETECFIVSYFSEDGKEGLSAFVEKREPKYKGR